MKLLYQFFLILFPLLASHQVLAQIGINNDNAAPDPSAMLDVKSTTSGFLTPRMTQAQRDAISAPATSLLIYQLDNALGYYYNNGTPASPEWVRIGNDEDQPICDSRIPIDSAAYFASYSSRFTAYLITEPGSYYLTGNIELVQANGTAIFIESDNVTLDLNGFSLIGPGLENSNSASDGIYIGGTRYNITIKNGNVNNWNDEGIDGFRANNCLFQNVIVSNCISSGFYLFGTNNLIVECHAHANGQEGFRTFEGCNFIRSKASQNVEDGFVAFEGTQFINCTAIANGEDGIDGTNEIMVLGCVATDNGEEGIELNSRGLVHKCIAFNNIGSGISVGFNTQVSFNYAALNNGDGILMRESSGMVHGCVAHENGLSGIHSSSTSALSGVVIENNGVTDNAGNGIQVSGTGVLVLRNRAAGNTGGADYNLGPGTNHGPIINITNAGDISNVAGANHPAANYIY